MDHETVTPLVSARNTIIYVEPIVKARLDKMVSGATVPMMTGSRQIPSRITELLATTIATQITVLPYLLDSVGSVSLVSFVSNVLILGFVPVTMLIGFIATLLAVVSTTLAWLLAFVSHLFLAWILGVAHTLGNLRFASVKISHFPGWLIFICYAIYMFLIKIAYSRMKPPA